MLRTHRPPQQQPRRAKATEAWRHGIEKAKAGQHKAAVAFFREAVKLEPADSTFWLNLARSEQILGHADSALEASRKAWNLNKPHMPTGTFLCKQLIAMRKHAEALEILERLAKDHASSVELSMLQGRTLNDMGHFEKAAVAFSTALSLAPQNHRHLIPDIGHRLGNCLIRLEAFEQASECYRLTAALAPDALGSILYAAHFGSWSCDWMNVEKDWSQATACVERLSQRLGPDQRITLSPFTMLALSDDALQQKWAAEHANYSDAPETDALKVIGANARSLREPNQPLRVGFVSSDFHHHATSILITEVLEWLPRLSVETHLYSASKDDQSPLRRRIESSCSAFSDTRNMSDKELAEKIRSDQIDILVDLKGFTLNHRMSVFAHRPAPLQVAWLGYPGTSGAPWIDYIIGDPVVTPISHQAHFTEKIAQLPNCYQPNDSQRHRPAPACRKDHGLPENAFVFGCFNHPYKITSKLFSAWCQILEQTPGSVLWLLIDQPITKKNLHKAAAARGIAPQRIIFAPKLNSDAHLSRLALVDLALDCHPCNGHTTTSDALWCGVPVLTLQGQTFASRVASSLLMAVELEPLICTTLEQYVEQAVRHALLPGGTSHLKQHLHRQHERSPLFDGKKSAHDLSALLHRMFQRHLLGQAPVALAAGALGISDAVAPDDGVLTPDTHFQRSAVLGRNARNDNLSASRPTHCMSAEQ